MVCLHSTLLGAQGTPFETQEVQANFVSACTFVHTLHVQINRLTLHVPAPPYHIVESYFVLPANPDALEAVPFRRGQFLSATKEISYYTQM